MNGCPAGMEYDSNDDFDDYDDRPGSQFEEPTLASLVREPTTVTTTTKQTSIFGTVNQMDKVELEQSVSLSSEDMRLAIVKEDMDHVKRALDGGFGTDTLMMSGWTGLMYACESASKDVVALLLKYGANPNFQKDLFTPLMAVCNSSVRNEDSIVACAKQLIDAGAQVLVHDRHVMTPLMYASKLGYAKLVTLLCESGAKMDVQDTQGWSALTFACKNGFSNVVRVLLKYNASYNLTAFDGQKPGDVAFAHGHTMLADMLEKYDGDNIEQFQVLPDAASKSSGLTARYVSYGDLELFLYGLELGDLIPVLQQHKLDFQDLLKLTEDEMIEIGITQLGVRKKLLESIRQVHTNEWDTAALSREQMSKLTTLEISAVVANVAKHLQIIKCSVKYVNKHLHIRKNDLVSDNISLQKSLVDQCSEALQCAKSLQADIQLLHNDAVTMFPNIDRKAVDLIENGEQDTKKQYAIAFASLGGLLALSGCAYVAYKRLSVT